MVILALEAIILALGEKFVDFALAQVDYELY
jgi:hypothetical protein